MNTPNCPLCTKPLNKVRQGEYSMLSPDQFDSVKAGDWYCASCKGNEAHTGFKYFWDSEIKKLEPVCKLCCKPLALIDGICHRCAVDRLNNLIKSWKRSGDPAITPLMSGL